MLSEQFIAFDFNLPTHISELSKANEFIKRLKSQILEVKNNKTINNTMHAHFYKEIIRVLDYVGDLSTPAFAVGDELEKMYFKNFSHSPALAKQLWTEHYESIHHPYNILKNRCYRLLDEVDLEYKNVHGKNPPDWNN